METYQKERYFKIRNQKKKKIKPKRMANNLNIFFSFSINRELHSLLV